MNPQALLGITIGSTVMFVFGAIWLLLGFCAGRPSPGWLRAAFLIAGVSIAVWIAVTGIRARSIARSAAAPSRKEEMRDREIGRRFELITGAEGLAILVAVVGLNVAHRPNLILPVIAAIVGLHFFPLAALFGSPAYYVTGVLGCAISLAGFLTYDPALRKTVVGLSFGTLLWLTVAAILIRI